MKKIKKQCIIPNSCYQYFLLQIYDRNMNSSLFILFILIHWYCI